jgi:hypothetical protein
VDPDIEGIDRLYLNAYQPRLQMCGGVVGFFREQRGAVVASAIADGADEQGVRGRYSSFRQDRRDRYAKRQLQKAGIAFEALDNGIRTCADPQRLQLIPDEVHIVAVVRKWFARLSHPCTAAERLRAIAIELSILQAEFACPQVFDRPLTGRHLIPA